jgi:hypothetical protein
VEFDLGQKDLQARLRTVEPRTVVKVHVDENNIRNIALLKKLPEETILVINGEEYRNASRSPSRDITEVELFGVNLLTRLGLQPETEAEKRMHEKKVAFGLAFGKDDVTGRELLSDTEMFAEDVTHVLRGEYGQVQDRSFFLASAAVHDRASGNAGYFRAAIAARYLLAARNKHHGLAASEEENLLIEMLYKLQESREEFTTAAAAELLQEPSEEKYKQAKARVPAATPEAIRGIIVLLVVYSEPEVVIRAEDMKINAVDVNSIRSILEAA